jgi:acetyltransferase-like isoleucine patch superfamily enzyme
VSQSPKILAEVRTPHETVNDDIVIIASWCVEEGSAVRNQDVIANIETSKAVLDINAEVDGFLEIIHPEGAEVAVGELIGHIVSEYVAGKPSAAAASAAATTETSAASGVSISKKAQVLIDEHGVDSTVFEGQGLIREVDVIKYLELQVAEQQAAKEAPSPETSAAPATPSAQATSAAGAYQHKTRGLFSDAATSASDRGKGIVWLVWNYFWRIWLLGLLVRVAPRGVINILHRWRGVKMGDDCFIDPTATLETAFAENITLGNDVRITVGAIIMTHIKGPHYLRDTGLVPAVIAPVTIEDHAFIGVNSVIMPGITVGKASVVASGAVVVSNVPEYTMVAGNPAKVVKQFPKPESH